MPFSPRLLWVEDEAGARREIARVGTDPAGAERMAAKMVRRMVKLTAVPCRAANILKQEMLALGGDAAVARGSVACSVPETDVILIGSLKKLRLLSRRLTRQPFGLAALAEELAQLLARLDRPPQELLGRDCRLALDRPLIMGILNVTPDSFSDGGRYLDGGAAVARARQMAEEGADILDVGGESTRPGSSPVSAEEELSRVIPVVEALRRDSRLPISVDTTKAVVAREAVAAESGAGLFVMHTPDRPDRMQGRTEYRDLTGDVIAFLRGALAQAMAAGVAEEKLAVDPGIGFGKSAAGNLEILRRLREFQSLGRPVLLGTSRKGFIGQALGLPDPAERLHGTMATVALGVERGAAIFRVHDVRPAREAARMAWAVCREEPRED